MNVLSLFDGISCGQVALQRVGVDVDNYYGFEIDDNRRFVLADFTVTHNTVLSLNIISHVKKKTFIIVHKEFAPFSVCGKSYRPLVQTNRRG
jgi:hypothetical protein